MNEVGFRKIRLILIFSVLFTVRITPTISSLLGHSDRGVLLKWGTAPSLFSDVPCTLIISTNKSDLHLKKKRSR